MEGQVDLSLVFDSERKRVYLGVKGDINKATDAERKDLAEKLAAAFGYILGIEPQPAKPSACEDFEEVVPLPEDVAEEFEAAEGSAPEPTAPAAAEPEIEEPVMGFGGRRANLTARQIIEQEGEKGAKWLQDVALPAVLRNLHKYPQNEAKAEAIKKALEAFAKSK